MSWFQRWLLVSLIRRVRAALDSISESDLRKVAAVINLKIDMPKIPEDAEYRIILGTLRGTLDAAKELLSIVKV